MVGNFQINEISYDGNDKQECEINDPSVIVADWRIMHRNRSYEICPKIARTVPKRKDVLAILRLSNIAAIEKKHVINKT